MAELNPANVPATRADFKRIPMSIPRQKLEVPEIPGYHTHWFLARNVPRARQGGYELVKVGEVEINQFGVGNDTSISGNTDLGTNISLVGGGPNEPSELLYLMKIKEEWWQEDQKAIENRNASVMSAIFKDEKIVDSGPSSSNQLSESDRSLRYVKTALFQRPKRVAKP